MDVSRIMAAEMMNAYKISSFEAWRKKSARRSRHIQEYKIKTNPKNGVLGFGMVPSGVGQDQVMDCYDCCKCSPCCVKYAEFFEWVTYSVKQLCFLELVTVLRHKIPHVGYMNARMIILKLILKIFKIYRLDGRGFNSQQCKIFFYTSQHSDAHLVQSQ
jgi:hypothetical protein